LIDLKQRNEIQNSQLLQDELIWILNGLIVIFIA